ncbi:MAG TPA: hypothetical protein PKG84_01920 [Novosphingobium sp.]|nr:hypothetical protein [Novosphingobium sp.]
MIQPSILALPTATSLPGGALPLSPGAGSEGADFGAFLALEVPPEGEAVAAPPQADASIVPPQLPALPSTLPDILAAPLPEGGKILPPALPPEPMVQLPTVRPALPAARPAAAARLTPSVSRRAVSTRDEAEAAAPQPEQTAETASAADPFAAFTPPLLIQPAPTIAMTMPTDASVPAAAAPLTKAPSTEASSTAATVSTSVAVPVSPAAEESPLAPALVPGVMVASRSPAQPVDPHAPMATIVAISPRQPLEARTSAEPAPAARPERAAQLSQQAPAIPPAALAIPVSRLLPAANALAPRPAIDPDPELAGMAEILPAPAAAPSPAAAVQPQTAPLVEPAPLPRPHDFAALVDRLVAAREAAQPHAVSFSLAHGDFGPVHLRFSHDDTGLSVTMASANPDFARAAAVALPVAAASDASGQQTFGASRQPSAQGGGESQTGGQSGNSARHDERPAQSGQTWRQRPAPRDPSQRAGIFA